MSSSIKIKKADKEKLDRLQAKLTLTLGKKLTQEEIIAYLLELVEKKEKDLFEYILGDWKPLTDEEVNKLMELPEDWGIETKESDIDKILYGNE